MAYYHAYFPAEIFRDTDGNPLDGGYIYIGEVAQNPVTHPITVHWDTSGTNQASQPLRTINGYISNNGKASYVYVDSDVYSQYSMSIYDKNNVLQFTSRLQNSDPIAGNYTAKDQNETITGSWAFDNEISVNGVSSADWLQAGGNETITGTWIFSNEITVNGVSSANWPQSGAVETISGTWTFSNEISVNGVSSADWLQAGGNETITGTWIFNNELTINGVSSADYLLASDSPTITGTWTFSNEITVNGVSSADYLLASDSPTITGTWTFNNEISVNGVSSANWAQANASETITGDWDFTGALTKNSEIVYSAENGPLAGFRNKLINPYNDIWQRGTSFTVTTSGTYVADRYVVIFDGTANITVDQATLGTALKIGERWVTEGLRFTVNSKSGNTYIRLVQRIEYVTSIINTPAVLTTIIQGSGALTVPVRLRQDFGTAGSADVETNFDTDLSVTVSMQQLSSGVTIPSVSAATIDNTDSFVGVEYELINLAATDYVIIPAHQFEPGANVTPFEQRHQQQEQVLCERYYRKLSDGTPVNTNATSTSINFMVGFNPPMRSTPSISSLANINVRMGTIIYTSTTTQTVTNLSMTRWGGRYSRTDTGWAITENAGTITGTGLVPHTAFDAEL